MGIAHANNFFDLPTVEQLMLIVTIAYLGEYLAIVVNKRYECITQYYILVINELSLKLAKATGELTQKKHFRQKQVKVKHVICLCKIIQMAKERYPNNRRRLQTIGSAFCELVNYKYLK